MGKYVDGISFRRMSSYPFLIPQTKSAKTTYLYLVNLFVMVVSLRYLVRWLVDLSVGNIQNWSFTLTGIFVSCLILWLASWHAFVCRFEAVFIYTYCEKPGYRGNHQRRWSFVYSTFSDHLHSRLNILRSFVYSTSSCV